MRRIVLRFFCVKKVFAKRRMAVLPPDPVFNFRNEMGPVNCLCFHHSERLFCGTAKGDVYLWDLQVFEICVLLTLN